MPYAARVAPGDTLAGTVWFRAEHQLGLTVDAWGDGLLVVAGQAPPGDAMAVLTTHGLDEAARADLAERWTTWWPGT